MDFNEAVEKSKQTMKEGIDKVEDVRRSEKAEHVRDNVVDGFAKVMKVILPGSDKGKKDKAAQLIVEASVIEVPKQLPPHP